MRHLNNELVPIRWKVWWKSFAIHIQIVNIVGSLKKIKRNNCLIPAIQLKTKYYRSHRTLLRKVSIFCGVRVEQSEQDVCLGRVVKELAIIQFHVQKTSLVPIALPFVALNPDLQVKIT